MSEILTLREFAERVHISRQTGYHLLKTGSVPGAFRLGKKWCIPTSAFEKLAEAQNHDH